MKMLPGTPLWEQVMILIGELAVIYLHNRDVSILPLCRSCGILFN